MSDDEPSGNPGQLGKLSPGPWTWVEADEGTGERPPTVEGEENAAWALVDAKGMTVVCPGPVGLERQGFVYVLDADARAIAAVPEMIEVLRSFANKPHIGSPDCPCRTCRARRLLERIGVAP